MIPGAIVSAILRHGDVSLSLQIGIATKLPSGSYSTSNLDHDAFFEFLLNGGESYERVPKDRFDIDA